MPAKAGIARRLAYHHGMASGGWTYIVTNKPGGVLYTGVTANLAARIYQHRINKGSAFCRKYGLKRLVLAERHDTIEHAIAREKAQKAWRREWKVTLIESVNPGWDDLFEGLAWE